MKKIILSIVALFGMSVAFAQNIDYQPEGGVRVPSGYQGFLEQGSAFRFMDDMNTSVGFSTTHGFYFNSNTFIGIGFAIEGGNEFFGVPIFTAIKYNFSYSGKVTPTIQLRVGSYLSEVTGAYGDLAFGIRFGSSRDFAINVMLAGSFYSKYTQTVSETWNVATHSYDRVTSEFQPSSIGLRIGIEW